MRRALMLLAPRWLALHVVVIAACVTMALLGRWQWHVAHIHHGSVQNYAYAFQWWAFALFAVFMWGRVMRDALRRQTVERPPPPNVAPTPVTYRRYVMRTNPPDTSDPELAAYNAYLADLADRSKDEH
jgi:DNA-binding transcriptional regulator of glucitol operon